MPGKGSLGTAAALLLMAAVVGCRTPRPDLKPLKSPEVLAMPPNENRFDTPRYPAQALRKEDSLKAVLKNNPIIPTQGVTSPYGR
ncbi:MAG: hypothetical protein K2X38_11195 [Gemmataceae bacterium]|nr:hypothetical protein [Gemmataceae bacterium]